MAEYCVYPDLNMTRGALVQEIFLQGLYLFQAEFLLHNFLSLQPFPAWFWSSKSCQQQ